MYVKTSSIQLRSSNYSKKVKKNDISGCYEYSYYIQELLIHACNNLLNIAINI